MAVVPSDIFPAVRRFLLESGSQRTLKVFQKETGADNEEGAHVLTKSKKKLAKRLANLELTVACQQCVDAQQSVVPSDIFPAVRRFLLESGLQRTLKAFQKEIGADDAEGEQISTKIKKSLAKRLANLELTVACQQWLDGQQSVDISVGHEPQGNEAMEKPNRKKSEPTIEVDAPTKKRKRQEALEVEKVEEAPVAEAVVEQPAKEKKKNKALEVKEVEEAPVVEGEVEQPAKKKKKSKDEKAEQKSGVPFTRIDHDKWIATVKDDRLLNNTHAATGGDSWGANASADMLKVKGKGFRKEMAKKKRASWRGGGEIDQGTYSVKFASSDDE